MDIWTFTFVFSFVGKQICPNISSVRDLLLHYLILYGIWYMELLGISNAHASTTNENENENQNIYFIDASKFGVGD